MGKKELVDIVDSLGRRTGKTATREEVHEKGFYHRVVCGTLIDKNGYVVITKRSKTSDIFPRRWIPIIGGHVMAGESYSNAMIREINEEVGISLEEKDLYKTGIRELIDTSHLTNGKNKEVIEFMIAYLENPLEKMILNLDEVEAVKRQTYTTMIENIIRGRSPLRCLPDEFVYKSTKEIRKYIENLRAKPNIGAA